MRIEPAMAAAAGGERFAPRRGAPERPGTAQGDERRAGQSRGKALVAVIPPARGDTMSSAAGRPSGAFVAQLIANHLGFAQTRDRRRLDAGEANRRYGAAECLDLWPAAGQSRIRSI